ncbi:DedA family protein [Actinocatenispora thailandica]|uniref:DedA family protein n=1 Tax=Actinocatenispora thailandica TaxID=227318 RepID=UPI0031CFF60F
MSLILLADASTGGGLAGTVADWATKIMDVAGSPGAGLANALDSIIPVLPSEVILPLAGFAASRGSINLYAALVWTTIGSIVGSVVMYYIGAAFGRERVLRWAAKIPLVQVHEVERTEAFFRRHGSKAVFFGRFIPVFRSLISLPAGLERMPLAKFTLLSAAGSAIWNTVFVLAGYSLGANWATVEKYGSYFSKAIIVLIVLAIAYFVISRLLRRRREAAQREADEHPGFGMVGEHREADEHPGFADFARGADAGPGFAGGAGHPGGSSYPDGAGRGAPRGAAGDVAGGADVAFGPGGAPGPGRGGAPYPPGRPRHAAAPDPDPYPGGHAADPRDGRRLDESTSFRPGGHAADPRDGRRLDESTSFRPGGRPAAGSDGGRHGQPVTDARDAPRTGAEDSEPTLVKRFHGTVYGSRPTEPGGRP